MKCTIKDVARVAGVSPSTVSRVISGSARISPQTCQRIRQIMEEMNYQPNLAARSLVSQSANSVGVFMKANPGESLKHPFFAEALRGLSVRAAEAEIQLVLSFSPHAQEDLNTTRRIVSSGAAGGMILLSSQANDPVAEYLSRHKIPFVVIGQPDQAQDRWWVDNDNVLAGRLVTEHLLTFGHRRILLLGAKDGFTVTQLRQAGYEQAMKEAQISVDPAWILADPRNNAEALKELFSSANAPTAVIAMDDSWALWLMGQLGEWGLSVPKDVSLVGFNNSAFSPYTTPALTSVEIHPYE
ncbi:MAG: LacI family DNA-binding transcriptional regulator, partial [Clostridia bacterium]|nr:LacI family DNA-binding transcriptional regulator [Clostridia bacterium]